MMKKTLTKKNIIQFALTLAVCLAACVVLTYIEGNTSRYILRIARLCAINIVLALSMNLINGFTGLFSLGHAGFMAIGAYAVALLTIPVKKKAVLFMLEPLVAPLDTLVLPFGVALIIGGLIAAAAAFLIGVPVLRLRGDYLAIATMGFSEIIRVVIVNAQGLTNGAQGLKSIPANANIWWCYGVALLVIVFMGLFTSSSYGKALKAIREDEIAAEAMGVNLFSHKMLAFMASAFLAAIGGGLLASYNGTIGPDQFRVAQTYNVLMIVVMGGMGSITGSVVGAFIVTIGQELLRVLDGDINFGLFTYQGVSGMRMVAFSVLLLVIILFFRNGLCGTRELTWERIGKRLSKMAGYEKREAEQEGGVKA